MEKAYWMRVLIENGYEDSISVMDLCLLKISGELNKDDINISKIEYLKETLDIEFDNILKYLKSKNGQ